MIKLTQHCSAILIIISCFCAHLVAQDKYKILVRNAKLGSKKNASEDWDALGNRPDAYCIVSIDRKVVFVSGTAKDSLNPKWWTGTEYWNLRPDSIVEIKLVDSDAGKLVSRAGMAGIALQPDLPDIGKRLINDQLVKTNTDDLIAHWKGTFADLHRILGRDNSDEVFAASQKGKNGWLENHGLRQLILRIVCKPLIHSVEAKTTNLLASQLVVTTCAVNETKKSDGMKWDVGVGKFRNPDLQFMIYVNGSPVVLGTKNQDSHVGTWRANSPPLNLSDRDLITLSVTDADAGTLAARSGSVGLMFSNSLSFQAKQKLFEELSKASTDDQVFVWECEWGKLNRIGPKAGLQQLLQVGNVIADNGIKDMQVAIGSQRNVTKKKVKPRATSLSLELGSVTIASKKSNGKAWDFGGGKPDPIAKIYIPNSKSGWTSIGSTKKISDNFSGNLAWSSGARKFKSPGKIRIELIDSDVASDDLIDTFVIAVPESASSRTLSSKTVKRLEIRFR